MDTLTSGHAENWSPHIMDTTKTKRTDTTGIGRERVELQKVLVTGWTGTGTVVGTGMRTRNRDKY